MGAKAKLTFSTLGALILALIYFLMKVFDGTSLAVGSGVELGRIFVGTIILIIVAIIIFQIIRGIAAGIRTSVTGKPDEEDDEIEEDERDKGIEGRGDRIGFYTLSFSLVILLAHYWMHDLYPGWGFDFLTLDEPIEWAVSIVIAILFAEIVKWASMAISYRP